MATVSLTPTNVIAGVTAPVAAQQGIAPGTVWAVIYNATSSILRVQSAGGQRFLQPNQADVYPVAAAVPVPTVTPITTQPAGTYLGTITSSFYDLNDGAPQGFPQPLQPFPGGTVLIANAPTTPSPVVILSPGGAGSITITAATAVTGLQVQGQSGIIYATGLSLAAGQSTSVFTGSSQDTVFDVGFGSGTLASVSASPTGVIPPFSNNSVSFRIDEPPSPVIPADAEDVGIYVFGWELRCETSDTPTSLDLVDGAGHIFAVLIDPGSVDAFFADSMGPGPHRSPGQVTGNPAGGPAASSTVTVRFAYGP